MNVQMLVVLAVVTACALYAGWSLAPAVARRALAQAALRLPLPGFMARYFGKVVLRASAGCGCDGCDAPPSAAREQPIRIHRRPGP
ncbi:MULTISPECIES: DUF6587 family protein [unclassified Acidovorax]|uniref:DUF6587 family protein n=1 Tax=unclassified Acidovorax TaxID=2684926 RepID=UPI00070A27E1|nr:MULTISPECIES: DUF6587 family protein [unclassified Acidovorax]KRC24386.1 hypothetical protein ASE31_21485 [Acidovorax sp. Root217]KRC33553.1 hypothetical protein ASE28_10285 [Acidovorax sp. Root219]